MINMGGKIPKHHVLYYQYRYIMPQLCRNADKRTNSPLQFKKL